MSTHRSSADYIDRTIAPLSDDDMCEHGYVRDHAPHPAAGLEHCPVCDSPSGLTSSAPSASPEEPTT